MPKKFIVVEQPKTINIETRLLIPKKLIKKFNSKEEIRKFKIQRETIPSFLKATMDFFWNTQFGYTITTKAIPTTQLIVQANCAERKNNAI